MPLALSTPVARQIKGPRPRATGLKVSIWSACIEQLPYASSANWLGDVVQIGLDVPETMKRLITEESSPLPESD
jgi:hypothetical protein